VDCYETLTMKYEERSTKTIQSRKGHLGGLGAGSELARRRLRANPNRAFVRAKEKNTTSFVKE